VVRITDADILCRCSFKRGNSKTYRKRVTVLSKYKPLSDMVAPDVKDWKLVAENVKVSFQKRMKVEYRGKSYATHPPYWFTKKIKGKNVSIYAEDYPTKKAAGRAAPKGTSQISRSKTPDLTLTGNMLKEIVATSTGNTAKLEFQNGDKIEGLDRRGKFPMFDGETPASKNVNLDIEKAINKLYDKRVKAQSQKIVYRI
jgi:hypothetical protein